MLLFDLKCLFHCVDTSAQHPFIDIHFSPHCHRYFESVDVLSQRFIQRMFVDLTDPVELVQKNGGGPRLVSWLRIIAREEAIDKQFTNKRERTTSTSSTGRLVLYY